MAVLAWHFTNGDSLRDGRLVPPIGETLKYDGPLELCKSGLHASVRLINALWYSPGLMLHRVECAVDVLEAGDKLVCRERTIIARADMAVALVEFAEDCAKRAAAHAAAQGRGRFVYTARSVDAAYYAFRAAASVETARMSAHVSDVSTAAGSMAGAAQAARAAEAAALVAVDYGNSVYSGVVGFRSPDARSGAFYCDAEREHQNSTLELWFECMKGQPC